jgi:hypothetical protein
MILRPRSGAFLALLVLATLPLFAGSKIVHRWMPPGAPVPRLQKVLVVRIGENILVRQQFEDEMKRLLALYHVEGVQGYLFLPPKNDMMEGELKQRLKESSLDSILVVRARIVPGEPDAPSARGSYTPPSGYSTFWPFWNMAYADFSPAAPDAKDGTYAHVEFNLYATKDEKLVWSAETGIVKSKDFDKLGNEYARMLVNQLRKEKLIRKK